MLELLTRENTHLIHNSANIMYYKLGHFSNLLVLEEILTCFRKVVFYISRTQRLSPMPQLRFYPLSNNINVIDLRKIYYNGDKSLRTTTIRLQK